MSDPYVTTKFATDTATLAIFDPSCLIHRATDDADWWSTPQDELAEINGGNVLFVALGSDGVYAVEVHRKIGESGCAAAALSALLRVQSGCLYIGSGESVPAGDFGPETVYDGCLVAAPCGTCEVRVYRPEPGRIVVEYAESDGAPANEFTESPELD